MTRAAAAQRWSAAVRLLSLLARPLVAIRDASWNARSRWAGRTVRLVAVWSAILTVALPATPMQTWAADRWWDPDLNAIGNNTISGVELGGTGTWNTSALNWFNGTAGDVAWNNAGNDTAIFSGSPGAFTAQTATVTLGAPITVGGLSFNQTGYTVTGNTLTLAPGSMIALNDVATTVISSTLAGSNGFTLANLTSGGRLPSTLTIDSNSSGLTGDVTIRNGTTLQLSGANGSLAGVNTINLRGGLTLQNSFAYGGSNTDRIGNTADIVVDSNAALTFVHNGQAATNYSETFGKLSLQSGFLTYTGSQAASGQTSIVTASEGLERAGTFATVNFAGTNLGAAGGRNRIVLTGQATGDIGPWAIHNGTRFAAYNATNGVVAATTGTLLGTTPSDDTANVATSAAVTLDASINKQFKTVAINGNTARTLNLNGNTLSVTGLLMEGGNAHVVSVGSLQALADNAPLYVFTSGVGNMNISANIVDRALGSNALVVSATNIQLTGTGNTYSGGTIINSGTISIAADNRLGNVNGDVTFEGSGGLTFTASTQLNPNRTIDLKDRSLATLSGGNIANHNIQGKITGNGGLVILGGGTTHSQILSNTTNDFSGPTTVGLGTGAANTNAQLIVTGRSGTGLTTVNNLGVYRIQGANGESRGAIQVNVGGSLIVDNSAGVGGIKADRLNGNDLTLAGGAFTYTSGTGNSTDQIGALNLSGGASITLNSNATGSTVVAVDSLTRQPGATLTLVGRSFGATPGANVTNLVVAANGTGAEAVGGGGAAGSTTISINPYVFSQDLAQTGNAQFGLITNQVGGSMLANGFRNLSLANGEYATSISNGVSGLENVSLAKFVGGLNSGATQINALRLDTAGGVAGTGTLTVNSGAVLALNDNRGISVGTLAFGAREAVFNVTGELTASSAVSGTGGLTKAGAGLLTLNNTNTYTGPTNVNAGMIRSGATGTFDAGASLVMNNAAGVAVDLNGFNQTIGSLAGGGPQGGNILLGGATLTTGGDDKSTFYGGVISQTGGLTKTGTGTMRLGAANTYDGATTVSGGTLRLGIASALPATTSLSVGASGTVDLGGFAVAVAKLDGQGTVTNSGATAAITVGAGSGLNQSSEFNGLFTQTPVSPHSPAANLISITKIGSGTFTIKPTTATASNAGGTLTVTAGKLGLDFSSSTGPTTGVVGAMATTLNGGTLEVTGRNGVALTQTLGTLTVGAGGSVIKMVAGGGAFTTRLTFSGNAAIPATAGAALLIEAPTNTAVRSATNFSTATSVGSRFVFTNGTTYEWAANGGANTDFIPLATYTNIAGAQSGTTTANVRIIDGTSASLSGAYTAGSLRIVADTAGQSLDLGANNLTITRGVLFTGSQNFSINTTGGNITSSLGGGTNTNDMVFHTYGTGTLTLNASIRNSAVTTMTLTKAGTGKLILAADNTVAGSYNGGTFITGGTLSISNNNQLGTTATAAITINDGATLQTYGLAAVNTGTHTYSLTGGVATIDVGSTAPLTIGGAISGVGGLKKIGGGTLRINVASAFSGGTYVANGTLLGGVNVFLNSAAGGNLKVDSTGSVDMNNFTVLVGGIEGAGNIVNGGAAARSLTLGGNNLSTTYTGVLQATGTAANLTLIKNGTGTLTLGAASLYTGATTINNGTIKFGTGIDNALAGTAVTLGNAAGPVSAMLDLNGENWTTSTDAAVAITFYGTTSTASSRAILNIGSGGILTLAGGVTVTPAAGAAGFQAGALITGGTVDMTATRTFAVGDSINTPADLTIDSIVTGVGGLNKSGLGTLVLNGNNTYDGVTAIAGTIRLGHASALGDATGASGTGTTISAGSTLDLNGQAVGNEFISSIAGTGAGGIGALINNGSQAASLGGNVTMAAATTFGGSNDLTLNGIVAGGATFHLTKVGAGTLVLANASNSYSGNTIINQGTVSINADTNLGPAPGAATPGKIVLNGGTLLASANMSLSANRGIAVGPSSGTGSGTIEVPNGVILSYSGNTANNGAGTGTLVKAGEGTLQVGGTLGHTGGTDVQAGTLQLMAGGTIPQDVNVKVNGMFISAGTVGGKLTVESGGYFSPGSSPGIAYGATADWAGGSTFGFDMNDALGEPGPPVGPTGDPPNAITTGWDFLELTGLLELGGITPVNAYNKITIDFSTFSGMVPGLMANWDPNAGNRFTFTGTDINEWRFVTFGSFAINGDSSWNTYNGWLNDFFFVDTTNFQNPDPALPLGFGVYKFGNSLYITAATPEPSTLVIWSLLCGGGALAWRRRRKAAAAETDYGAAS